MLVLGTCAQNLPELVFSPLWDPHMLTVGSQKFRYHSLSSCRLFFKEISDSHVNEQGVNGLSVFSISGHQKRDTKTSKVLWLPLRCSFPIAPSSNAATNSRLHFTLHISIVGAHAARRRFQDLKHHHNQEHTYLSRDTITRA